MPLGIKQSAGSKNSFFKKYMKSSGTGPQIDSEEYKYEMCCQVSEWPHRSLQLCMATQKKGKAAALGLPDGGSDFFPPARFHNTIGVISLKDISGLIKNSTWTRYKLE